MSVIVSGAVRVGRGDFGQASGVARGWSRDVSLEELSRVEKGVRSRWSRGDDFACGGGVRRAIHAARATAWSGANPLLRVAVESPPPGATDALSCVDRGAIRAGAIGSSGAEGFRVARSERPGETRSSGMSELQRGPARTDRDVVPSERLALGVTLVQVRDARSAHAQHHRRVLGSASHRTHHATNQRSTPTRHFMKPKHGPTPRKRRLDASCGDAVAQGSRAEQFSPNTSGTTRMTRPAASSLRPVPGACFGSRQRLACPIRALKSD